MLAHLPPRVLRPRHRPAPLHHFRQARETPGARDQRPHEAEASRRSRARRSALAISRAEGSFFCRGSKASRSPSPMKFTLSTTAMMNTPGHQNSHGRVEKELWYSLIIVPNDTFGAWILKPR